MKMEDKTRKDCSVYSVKKGETFMYKGDIYMKTGSAYDGILLAKSYKQSNNYEIGDIVNCQSSLGVEKVNAKVVIEVFED